jgi:hypothetical protein
VKFFEITQNKVLAFALLCVAISSGFVMYMQVTLVHTLSSPDWCARAINAEKLATVRGQSSIGICAALFDKQLGTLGIGLLINAGTVALCLLVLMVIVVAGGRLSFSVSKTGASANIGKTAVAQAAKDTADAVVDKAEEIADDTAEDVEPARGTI